MASQSSIYQGRRSRRSSSFQKDRPSALFAKSSFTLETNFNIEDLKKFKEASWTLDYLDMASLLPILTPGQQFYPRLVRLFYESIRRKRGHLHSEYTINIDGHIFDINAKVISDALGIPSTFPDDCLLQKPNIPVNIADVISNFRPFDNGTNYAVNRFELPPYLLFFDTVVQRNIFSNGHDYERLGAELHILYAADFSQWFSPADKIINNFFSTSRDIKENRFNGIKLHNPFLISTVLKYLGLPISEDEPTGRSPIQYDAWILHTNKHYLEKARKRARKDEDVHEVIFID